jgi:hypothetical protein
MVLIGEDGGGGDPRVFSTFFNMSRRVFHINFVYDECVSKCEELQARCNGFVVFVEGEQEFCVGLDRLGVAGGVSTDQFSISFRGPRAKWSQTDPTDAPMTSVAASTSFTPTTEEPMFDVFAAVKDASNGNDVSGAVVTFHVDGQLVDSKTYTGAEVSVALPQSSAQFTVRCTVAGFNPFEETFLYNGRDEHKVVVTLNPTMMDANLVRIVLSWPNCPADLDAELTVPWSNSPVTWESVSSIDPEKFVSADLVVQGDTAYGIETIEITSADMASIKEDCYEFRHAVYVYSNCGGYGRSGAVVRVFHNNTKLLAVTVPSPSAGRYDSPNPCPSLADCADSCSSVCQYRRVWFTSLVQIQQSGAVAAIPINSVNRDRVPAPSISTCSQTTIRGFVLNTDTGAGLPNVPVQVASDVRSYVTMTDAAGEFVQNASLGLYTVSALRLVNYTTPALTVSATVVGETHRLTLPAAPYGTAGYRVVLTWSACPLDLDLSVVVPWATRGEPVTWENTDSAAGDMTASFVQESNAGHGVEVVRISRPPPTLRACQEFEVYSSIYSNCAGYEFTRAQVFVFNETAVLAVSSVPTRIAGGYDNPDPCPANLPRAGCFGDSDTCSPTCAYARTWHAMRFSLGMSRSLENFVPLTRVQPGLLPFPTLNSTCLTPTVPPTCQPGFRLLTNGSCEACAPGTFTSFGDLPACASWTVCKSNEAEQVAPNATTNRVCVRYRVTARVLNSVTGALIPNITVSLTTGSSILSNTTDANGRIVFDLGLFWLIFVCLRVCLCEQITIQPCPYPLFPFPSLFNLFIFIFFLDDRDNRASYPGCSAARNTGSGSKHNAASCHQHQPAAEL